MGREEEGPTSDCVTAVRLHVFAEPRSCVSLLSRTRAPGLLIILEAFQLPPRL